MKSTLFLLALAASGVFGQQSTTSGQSGVISQVVDGDGWQTIISLNNIDASPSLYKLSFFDDTGAPLSLQTNILTGPVIYGAIPAHGSVTIQTAGTQTLLSQGWALMETVFVEQLSAAIAPGATVAGTVIFQRPPTVSRPSEASEPLDFSGKPQWVLPFDHTNGYTSGIALVNPDRRSICWDFTSARRACSPVLRRRPGRTGLTARRGCGTKGVVRTTYPASSRWILQA